MIIRVQSPDREVNNNIISYFRKFEFHNYYTAINKIDDTLEWRNQKIDAEELLSKYFTNEESKLFMKKKSSIAGNFATKEAVSKVFGTGVRKFSLKDIEVLRDELGKPYVNLYNNARKIADDLKISTIHISISDTDKYAIAYAIGERIGSD